MNKLIFYSGIILLTIFSACKPSFNVSSENLTNKSLARLKTFKFYNPANMPATNFAFSEKNKKRLFDAVAEEMINRGFSSTQDADLIIKIQGGTSQEIEDNEPYYRSNNYYNNSYYGGGYYPYSWNRDPWMYDDISKKTTIIIVDVLDPGSNKLLWQGTGSGVLSDKTEQVETHLRKAVADIFLEFPAPIKSSN